MFQLEYENIIIKINVLVFDKIKAEQQEITKEGL